jgi:cyclophilin family peptidyl-prolyl cis-trans isomerase
MVTISSKSSGKKAEMLRGWTIFVSILLLLTMTVWFYGALTLVWQDESMHSVNSNMACPVTFISQLSPTELHPVAGDRHMVTPPDGGTLTLLCFQTTKGPLSLLLHEAWAPIGVQRLLDMVSSGYFATQIPLFRCTDACQFGLSGNPQATQKFDTRLNDDPPWLPPGKDYRQNEQGVSRYPRGFLTFAGAGPHSRSNQLVLTLKPNRFMGGGSPWEVPLGEVVGSSHVLDLFYTGYGEKGPSQALLRREGTSQRVQKEWPLMDYILDCQIVDQVQL